MGPNMVRKIGVVVTMLKLARTRPDDCLYM